VCDTGHETQTGNFAHGKWWRCRHHGGDSPRLLQSVAPRGLLSKYEASEGGTGNVEEARFSAGAL
jgi:hypothetical protein